MARTFSLDNRVWAINGERTDPDTVNTAEANLLNVADGHIDSQGPYSDIMNWEQYRVSHMLNAIEQTGILEWSSKTTYGEMGLCQGSNGQIYQSRKSNNKNHPVTDTVWWIEYEPSRMGDMLKSVYDTDGNGIVDKASAIDGIVGSANHTYYGKNESGVIGFHAVPPDGDMKKSVYDTNNNGRADNADNVFGSDTAGASKYYGTNKNDQVGFWDLPPDGDMLKSIYDTNDNGRVDISDSVFGVNTAPASSYYGKDSNGTTGFFAIADQLPVYAKRWPTPAEIGALRADDTAADSLKLNGAFDNVAASGDTIVKRDSGADINVRSVKASFATQSDLSQIPATSSICFRVNDSTDNHMRFMDKDTIQQWLSLTPDNVGLSNIHNYPISHIASENANAKDKYASEFAVGIAWKLAKQAYESTLVGGKVDSAKVADALSISRVIALTGDVAGSVNFNGSQNVNMSVTVANNSHTHDWWNITGVPNYAKRWPTPAEIGLLTNAQNDQRFLGKNNKAVAAGTADIAVRLDRDRTNYVGFTDGAVVGQLGWTKHGNNHTIFDASSGKAPNGSAINNSNSSEIWSGTRPTLMGWNGQTTFGVRVDSARNADVLQGSTKAQIIASAVASKSSDAALFDGKPSTDFRKVSEGGLRTIHRGQFNTGDSYYNALIARMATNTSQWSRQGPLIVELYNKYYNKGGYKKYLVQFGYKSAAARVVLVEAFGDSGKERLFAEAPVVISGTTRYVDIKLNTDKYSQTVIVIKTCATYNSNKNALSADQIYYPPMNQWEHASTTSFTPDEDLTVDRTLTTTGNLYERSNRVYSKGNKPTPADLGALAVNGVAKDSSKLNNRFLSPEPTGNTVTMRTDAGDINARLFKSTFGTQSSIPVDAAICYRNEAGTGNADNYMRFVSKAGFQTWLGAQREATYGIADPVSTGAQEGDIYIQY